MTKIKHGGEERSYTQEEIKKLLDEGIIVDSGNGYYELKPGKSWRDVEEVLKPKTQPKPKRF